MFTTKQDDDGHLTEMRSLSAEMLNIICAALDAAPAERAANTDWVVTADQIIQRDKKLGHMAGEVWRRVRYRHQSAPPALCCTPPWVDITDVGARRIGLIRGKPENLGALTLRDEDGLGRPVHFLYDYDAIIRAVAEIRGVHGAALPVHWNLDGPAITTAADLAWEMSR